MSLVKESAADLNLTGDVHAAVQTLLRGWGGFPGLQAAMRTCPRTEVYLAGGAVRDLIRSAQRPPRDFDLFLGGFDVAAFVDVLHRRGTVRCGPFGSPRWFPGDAGTHYADVIPIEHFHNGLWKCRDMVDVLNQFDFTANAVGVDLRRARLFDPQNGVRDGREGVLRAVRFDYPDEPISAQTHITRPCVLWFRLLHYSSELGLDIEPVTRGWLRKNRHFSRDAAEFARLFFPPRTADI